MSFVNANGHPNPDSPEDPLHHAPRSVRSLADPRSSATPQTRADHLPPASSLSRFDEMREEAFAKFTRPLESQLAYERRPRRVLLATVGGIAAIGVTVIAAFVLFSVFPEPKTNPSELAVSISTPAQATPAEVTSGDSRALLQGFTQFQKVQGSETPEPAVSELTSAGTVKEGAEKPQALLEKFMQWERRK
jgi:hypothetical protein